MKYIFYPFEFLGDSLRSLSLTSSTGNVISIIIYCVVSLIPCMIYLWLYKKKKAQKIDGMLLGLSAVLFFIIYYLINPTPFMQGAYANIPEMGDYMLIGFFYSLAAVYLVFKGMIYCTDSKEENLQKGLCTILYVIIGILAISIVTALVGELPEAIGTLNAQNSMDDLLDMKLIPLAGGLPDVSATILFLIVQKIVETIPKVFEIVILVQLTRVIRCYAEDRYSEQVRNRLEVICCLCMTMLKTTILSNVLLNLIQILLRKQLYAVSMDISIPVTSIALVLGILLISRYVRDSQKLKEENDMFI